MTNIADPTDEFHDDPVPSIEDEFLIGVLNAWQRWHEFVRNDRHRTFCYAGSQGGLITGTWIDHGGGHWVEYSIGALRCANAFGVLTPDVNILDPRLGPHGHLP